MRPGQVLAWGAAGLGVGLVLVWLAKRAGEAVGGAVAGAVTGNNALTQGATDWAGQPVTAYEGAGVLGTAGAAANAASGGVLASIGSWLGTTVYDYTHPSERVPVAPPVSGGGWAAQPMPGAGSLEWVEPGGP